MTANLLEEFSSATFRTNALRLWGMEENLFSTILKAHHIIPQALEVQRLLNKLGIDGMVHNPLFSALLTKDEHAIIHAGAGAGGWYNRMWIEKLSEFEGRGVHGNNAVNAIIDFIGDTVLPRVRDALQRGGPPVP
jgi:hypothetical protein